MTRLTIILISLISTSLILPGIGDAKIDPESVVGMWLFDEGSGKVAEDSSGNGNDGEFIGKPKWVEGKFGEALEFDGASTCVKISPGLTDLENITVVVWVYSEDDWGKTTRQEIWCGSNTYGDYLLLREDERGDWHAGEAMWHWYDGGSWGAIPSGSLKNQTWYHLAGSYDGSDLKLYLNGKLVGSESTSIASGSMDTCIGCHPTPTNWWNGMIDEVAVFDIALTEEEIKSIITYGLENMNPVSPSGRLSTTWGKIKNRY